jgi:hypothetical protein
MSQKTKTKISFAGFQYDGFFGDPILNNPRLLPLVQPFYDALKKLNIRPQDVKYKNPAAANDASVSFELALGRIVLHLSHAGFTLTVQNADWSQAELVAQVVESCWKAVDAILDIKVNRHELQIGMAFIPEGKSQKEITKSFAVPWQLRQTDDLGMCGLILYTATGTFVVDRAAANPQAMYAKITHRFEGQTAFSEMLKQLQDDETWLADALRLEFE